MSVRCNFHMHTTCSDGAFTPKEAVNMQKDAGLDVIAITDHDSVDGIDEAKDECEKVGMRLVPGIELSSFSINEIHILGYNFDYKNPEFQKELTKIRRRRKERNVEIVEKLKNLGIFVDEKELGLENDSIGRHHIAIQMKKQGYVQSVSEAFDKYLGVGQPAHSAGNRLKPFEAVRLIKKYGGIPVIAHPLKLYQDKKLIPLIEGLLPFGLKGLECHYGTHNETDTETFLKIAKKYGLIATGGTDMHNADTYVSPSYRDDRYDAYTLRTLKIIK